jgi:hypothetical protein
MFSASDRSLAPRAESFEFSGISYSSFHLRKAH